MTARQKYYPWVVMLACCLFLGAVMGVGTNCNGVFMKPVADSLGVGIGDVSAFTTVMGIMGGLMAPVVGHLIYKLDVRILMTIALTVEGGGYVMISRVSGLAGYWVIGGVIGLGIAFGSFLTVTVILNNWFIKNNGTVIGLTLSASSLVGIFMNPLFNSVIQSQGWRAGYSLMGTIILCVLPVIWLLVRMKPSQAGAVAWGGTLENPDGVPHTEETEKGEKKRVKMPPALPLMILFTFITSAFVNHLSHMPNIAASVGLTASVGAIMVSCGQAGEFTGKLAVGHLSDRFGVLKAIYIVGGSGIFGVVGLMFVTSGTPALAFLCAYFYGVMTAIGSVGYSLVAKQLFGVQQYPRFYPYISITSMAAFSIGFPVIGYIYDAMGTYKPTYFVTFAGIMLAMVVLTLAMKKKRPQ